MSGIVYKLYFFIMLTIFFSFGVLIKLKLDYWKQYHGLDFVGIDNNFTISTGKVDFNTKNIIYVTEKPSICINNKNSIKCLAELKEKGGIYNGLAFFSGYNYY